jgi:hypothetical protein
LGEATPCFARSTLLRLFCIPHALNPVSRTATQSVMGQHNLHPSQSAPFTVWFSIIAHLEVGVVAGDVWSMRSCKRRTFDNDVRVRQAILELAWSALQDMLVRQGS